MESYCLSRRDRFGVIDASLKTVEMGKEGIRKNVPVDGATVALATKEMPKEYNRTQLDQINAEQEETIARDTRPKEENAANVQR